MKKVVLTIIFQLLLIFSIKCQKFISITIDDVPNTGKYQFDNYHHKLLDKLDSLNVPVTIFINTNKIDKTDVREKNLILLKEWSEREYVTLGNHTHSHLRYSETYIDTFWKDIMKCEEIIHSISKKPITYFRFPYNDLGKDSAQYVDIENITKKGNYIITPFTIESSDYAFNYLYSTYLNQDQNSKAKEIAHRYIESTLNYINFFDSIAISQYGYSINQIYLCHDNSINADYMDVLVDSLKTRNYQFISLKDALKDSVYQQPEKYYQKWGISWIYRWMASSTERKEIMKSEPDISDIMTEFESKRNP